MHTSQYGLCVRTVDITVLEILLHSFITITILTDTKEQLKDTRRATQSTSVLFQKCVYRSKLLVYCAVSTVIP